MILHFNDIFQSQILHKLLFLMINEKEIIYN